MIDAAEAVVNLTENAANEIKARLAADPAGAGKGLRIYVEQGGCSGLQYGMTFDEKRDGDLTATLLRRLRPGGRLQRRLPPRHRG